MQPEDCPIAFSDLGSEEQPISKTLPPQMLPRRTFLLQTACIAGAALLAGCNLIDEDETLIGPIATLKQGGFRVIRWNRDDYFLSFDEQDQAYALNLTCTHKQCTVKFQPDADLFICPCHKGQYDRKGIVLKGKPPAPLTKYKTEDRGGELWLINKKV